MGGGRDVGEVEVEGVCTPNPNEAMEGGRAGVMSVDNGEGEILEGGTEGGVIGTEPQGRGDVMELESMSWLRHMVGS